MQQLQSQIDVLEAKLRSVIDERDEAISLAVKSSRDVALLEEAKLRETELLKIAHSAQETAEDDIHRQMLIVEKYRKAQKVAEGRLKTYSQLEERLKIMVNRGDITKDQFKWLFEIEKVTPVLKPQSASTNNSSVKESLIWAKVATKTRKYKFSEDSKNRKRGRKIAQVRSATFDRKDKYISSRIKRMSVAELRQLLDKHRVPHKDCIEKAELIFRAQQALRANETVEKSKMKDAYDEAVNVSSPHARETGWTQEESHHDENMENSRQHRNNAEEECQRPPFDNVKEPV